MSTMLVITGVFQELRPENPYQNENGRTAEGPYEADNTHRLMYPSGHSITRFDQAKFDLWSVAMSDLKLGYHAWHTIFDKYFSDSGGGWIRTSDPLNHERNENRWQVLVHPEHWRGQKKTYFFLSTARSGSKWLSEVLNRATPLKTRHEYILNQPFHRKETLRKCTENVWELEDSSALVRSRMIEAWEEFEASRSDVAEVNIYLANFLVQLRTVFPEATFVHLSRDPVKVVNSLLNRNWYDTPEDQRHPRLKTADMNQLTQFEEHLLICQRN